MWHYELEGEEAWNRHRQHMKKNAWGAGFYARGPPA